MISYWSENLASSGSSGSQISLSLFLYRNLLEITGQLEDSVAAR